MPITTPAIRRAVLAGSSALAVLLASACGSDDGHGSMNGSMHGSSSSSSSAAKESSDSSGAMSDVMFAQMMIPHHQQAIDMADLALAEAAGASTQVKGLAKQIADAQGPEIAMMESWLKAWGAEATPSMHMGHDMAGMMSDADMDELKAATGADFDRRWLTMMIEHHEGAITMARGVLMMTKNADVEELANAIISGQEKEIATMKSWLG